MAIILKPFHSPKWQKWYVLNYCTRTGHISFILNLGNIIIVFPFSEFTDRCQLQSFLSMTPRQKFLTAFCEGVVDIILIGTGWTIYPIKKRIDLASCWSGWSDGSNSHRESKEGQWRSEHHWHLASYHRFSEPHHYFSISAQSTALHFALINSYYTLSYIHTAGLLAFNPWDSI